MKKYHIEKVEKEVEVFDDVICNRCGESCKVDNYNFEGLIEARICGGYGAKLGDGIAYEFSLCESCLEVLFKDFKIPPLKDMSGYLGGGLFDAEGNELV